MNKVLELICKRPGMTEREIAKALYGKDAVQQMVNPDCRMLVSLGLVERGGVGGPGDPYVYRATEKAVGG
jgi:predicted transcriptional regulator